MTEFFVSIAQLLVGVTLGIVLAFCVLTAFFFWRPALLVIAVVAAGFILVGCTGSGVQPGCEDLERSILAKDICARLRNCELTVTQIEQWMRDSRAYRLHCVAPETKLPSVS